MGSRRVYSSTRRSWMLDVMMLVVVGVFAYSIARLIALAVFR